MIYAGNDGVFLRELAGGAYMLSVSSFDKGKELTDSVGEQPLVCVHQQYMADYLLGKYGYQNHLECFQAVYLSREHKKMNGAALDIKSLGVEYADIIYSHYHEYVDWEYLHRRLAGGEIYGGFAEGKLCGFVGTHEEGGIGILEVFGQYRKRGFGEQLESYMINLMLDQNQTPFGQISIDNEPSIKLQKKLGLKLSSDTLHWLF